MLAKYWKKICNIDNSQDELKNLVNTRIKLFFESIYCKQFEVAKELYVLLNDDNKMKIQNFFSFNSRENNYFYTQKYRCFNYDDIVKFNDIGFQILFDFSKIQNNNVILKKKMMNTYELLDLYSSEGKVKEYSEIYERSLLKIKERDNMKNLRNSFYVCCRNSNKFDSDELLEYIIDQIVKKQLARKIFGEQQISKMAISFLVRYKKNHIINFIFDIAKKENFNISFVQNYNTKICSNPIIEAIKHCDLEELKYVINLYCDDINNMKNEISPCIFYTRIKKINDMKIYKEDIEYLIKNHNDIVKPNTFKDEFFENLCYTLSNFVSFVLHDEPNIIDEIKNTYPNIYDSIQNEYYDDLYDICGNIVEICNKDKEAMVKQYEYYLIKNLKN